MAKLSEAQTKLLTHATQPGGIYTGMYRPTINALIKKGYLVETSRNQFEATPAGLAYLYQDAPMVDQPQPPSEVETVAVYVPQVGDTVEYPGLDGKREIGTITDIVERSLYGNIKIAAPTGKIVDRHAKDIRLITDIGNDPDDTQELPTVKVEAEMSLSELVDAALLGATPCKRIDALRTLRNGFDWASVPSDALEAELIDVNQAFDDAMAARRKARIRCLHGDNVTLQDVKQYAQARTFCDFAEYVSNIVYEQWVARKGITQIAWMR